MFGITKRPLHGYYTDPAGHLIRQGKRLPNDMVISPYDPDRKPRSIRSLKSDAPPANRKICPVTHRPFLVPAEPRVAQRAPAAGHDGGGAHSVSGVSGAREMRRENTSVSAAASAPPLAAPAKSEPPATSNEATQSPSAGRNLFRSPGTR